MTVSATVERADDETEADGDELEPIDMELEWDIDLETLGMAWPDFLEDKLCCHQIRWVLGTFYLEILCALSVLDILYPQCANVDMSEFACAFPLRYRQRGRRVGVESHS